MVVDDKIIAGKKIPERTLFIMEIFPKCVKAQHAVAMNPVKVRLRQSSLHHGIPVILENIFRFLSVIRTVPLDIEDYETIRSIRTYFEDKEASRRVEFKFSLKDAQMIEEMNRILNQGQ